MFPHYIIGPPQREEILREILIIFRGVFKFHFLKYATMNFVFCWEANISLVVLSCGLRETSRVDYTERRKSERKKFLLNPEGGPWWWWWLIPPSPLPSPTPSPSPPKERGKGGGGGGGGDGGGGGRRGKRVSTGLNVFQQVWTCPNRF